MVFGQKVYCDFCQQVCLPNDFISIHIEADGEMQEFTFHNTLERPCLKAKLARLHSQFLAPTT
jgi:hypothetical protein